MRFTALLFLAALAGTLVCAQDSTLVQEPVSPKANETTTCVVESTSPQKTAQETSAVTQEKTSLVFKPLRLGVGKGLGVEKGLELAKGAREKLLEKFEDGRKFLERLGVGKGLGVEKGLELAKGARGRLRERLEDGRKFLESLGVRKVSG
ncbi:uncharacterized protein LOC123619521 isoform X1 [Camelus bactrianus]|uniref:Uncharacterized protein LOC123619521 isoform X1 n=2 Tax=Camelus bactrianus TaxID=9837 RepID=A0AC58RBX8_CAMBA